MSEFRLTPKSGLGLDRPVAEHWPEFTISEIERHGVWWMSAPADGEEALGKACRKAFAADLPERGGFSDGKAKDGPVRILWAGDRQWFVTGEMSAMPAAVEKTAAITDQSDGWVAVRIEGAKTRAVMESLCGLDLHPAAFATGKAARAPVEGMHALIACEDASAGTYVVYFQRSSARSFVEHFRHAAHSASPRQ